MRKELFDILVDKYLAGTADESERKIVEEYLDRMSAKYPGGLSEDQIEANVSGIYERLARQISSGEAPVVPIRRRSFRRIAIAAAVLLMASAGALYYYSGTSSFKNNLVVASTADVLPGRTVATLTLADGRQIILDSSATGILAVEGATNITGENGEISYSNARTGSEELYNILATRRGEQYRALRLSDGTKVWLNSNSSIRFPVAFIGKERRVEITGEAYFEVAKNAAKPFKIKAEEKVEVEVLGTRFNINSYPDEQSIKTTLIEGSVKVLYKDNKKLLLPGQQASADNNSTNLNLVKDVDVEEVVAWKDGLFQFESADLEQVMRQLSRWYDVDVVFTPGVPDRKFFGSITRDIPLSGILKILKASDVNYRIEGRKLIVTK